AGGFFGRSAGARRVAARAVDLERRTRFGTRTDRHLNEARQRRRIVGGFRTRCIGGFGRFGRLRLLRRALRFALALEHGVFFNDFIDQTLIMLGVLEIILHQHFVAGSLCIARQRGKLLDDLLRRAAHASVRTVAVEHLIDAVDVTALAVLLLLASALPAMTIVMMMTASAVIIMTHESHER